MTAASARYTPAAIALHWVMAAAILAMLAAGLWMVDALKVPATRAFAYDVYQWHKALGLTILVLALARLAWRWRNPPPPLPAGVSSWERTASSMSHTLLYALMIAMPLIGWAMVSASPLGLPTMVFGLFEWPHIPWLAALEDKAPVEAVLKRAHRVCGYLLGGLVAIHVLAALKHQFINRDGLMRRMWPWPAR